MELKIVELRESLSLTEEDAKKLKLSLKLKKTHKNGLMLGSFEPQPLYLVLLSD